MREIPSEDFPVDCPDDLDARFVFIFFLTIYHNHPSFLGYKIIIIIARLVVSRDIVATAAAFQFFFVCVV